MIQVGTRKDDDDDERFNIRRVCRQLEKEERKY
jgi:hypothetical protein